MWPFPFHVRGGPRGRLHIINVERAIVSGELRIAVKRLSLLPVLNDSLNLLVNDILFRLHMDLTVLISILLLHHVLLSIFAFHVLPELLLVGLNHDALFIVVLLTVHV